MRCSDIMRDSSNAAAGDGGGMGISLPSSSHLRVLIGNIHHPSIESLDRARASLRGGSVFCLCAAKCLNPCCEGGGFKLNSAAQLE